MHDQGAWKFEASTLCSTCIRCTGTWHQLQGVPRIANEPEALIESLRFEVGLSSRLVGEIDVLLHEAHVTGVDLS